MFALGYYHQLHHRFQGINEGKAAKARKAAEAMRLESEAPANSESD